MREYWNTWLWSTMPRRIITVNFIAWLLIAAGAAMIPASDINWWIGLFGVPPSIFMLPSRIWTVATYMISHFDFMHLLVNMLWLLLFGTILEMRVDRQKLLAVYVVSGLAGAAAFIVCNIISPGGSVMIGASCAVIGVAGACIVLAPNVCANLLFLGRVRVLWIALAAVALFVIFSPDFYMRIAHAAGLCAGYAWGVIERGSGISLSWPKRQYSLRKGDFAQAITRAQAEQKLDELLAKVSLSGYASLSSSERQQLFELSQRLK